MSMEPSPLQREIKQTKPFRSRSQEAGLALLRTADVVRRHVLDVLEPHDLTLQQYNVLRILRGAGEGGLPTLEIAVRMVEQAPGITRLLDRLEAKTLVRRERCKVDRRQVLCYVTEDGLSLLARLDEPILVADRKSLGSLSPRDLDTLVKLLDAVRASCRGSCPPTPSEDPVVRAPKPPRPSTEPPHPDRVRSRKRRTA